VRFAKTMKPFFIQKIDPTQRRFLFFSITQDLFYNRVQMDKY